MTLDVAAKIPAILLISVLSALTELVPGGERFLSSLSITAPYNCCLHMVTDLARMCTYFAQWTITSVYRSWRGCWQRTCYNRIGTVAVDHPGRPKASNPTTYLYDVKPTC
jgi:hypothetical protein